MKTGVYFEEEKSGFAAIYAIYNAGGIFEKKGYRGVSHLAEHLKCKKEKDFKKLINISNIETNACTDDDATYFYCKGGDKEIATFAEKYLSVCLPYVPTEKEFEEEKSIILQEYDSYLSDYPLYVEANRSVFDFSGPIGVREDIEEIGYKKFLRFYVEHFSKPSCLVFVGGKAVKKAYLKLKDRVEIETNLRKERLLNSKLHNKTVESGVKRSSDCQMLLSFLDRDCGFSELSLRFFVNMMSDGFFSPLIEIIREKHNLCYWVNYSIEPNKEYCICLTTETKFWPKMLSVYKDILENFQTNVPFETYNYYVQKLETKIRHINMTPSHWEYIQRKYTKPVSLTDSFDKNSPEYSYETMCGIADKLAKNKKVQSIVHHGKTIRFAVKGEKV